MRTNGSCISQILGAYALMEVPSGVIQSCALNIAMQLPLELESCGVSMGQSNLDLLSHRSALNIG